MSPATIADHLDMIASLDGGVAARHDSTAGVHRLTIVTADRPGILSEVAGAVAVEELSILGGTVFTRDDGVAIDVLHVAPSDAGHATDWDAVCAAIVDAVQERVDFADRLATLQTQPGSSDYRPSPPATVTVNNSESEQFSILEVRTVDRRGVLYAITHALSQSGFDIHLAKVDTVSGEVFDAFYLRRSNGRRVEAPDEIERLTRNIQEALSALDAA
jgi:[protein-PII] uridylyltransferase